jgi:hypothetical protein
MENKRFKTLTLAKYAIHHSDVAFASKKRGKTGFEVMAGTLRMIGTSDFGLA